MKNSKIIKKILADKNFIKSDRYTLEDTLNEYKDYLFDTNLISLETVLKDKKFMRRNKFLLNDVVDDYLDYKDDENGDLKPRVKAKNNYVGIEIECFTRYDRLDLLEKIIEHNLDKIVQPVGDGSISPDFGDECELRILLPEKKLASGLKQVGKLFTKGKFGINDTCGLHIHLDMRNRNVDECYKRLLKFQDILFGMVKRERWKSTYCSYSTGYDTHNRYVAINKDDAYRHHKTIEIRLHHATLDMKRIEQWVKLLLRVIGSKTPPPKQTRAEVLKWAKKQKGLGTYISKNFNEKWFDEKKKIASGGGDW